MKSKGIDWKEVMDLVSNDGDINLNQLKEELNIEDDELEEIVNKLERGGIDVLTNEEEELKERISRKNEDILKQTDEPIKLYLREMKDISLLTRRGEYTIGAKMEKGRKMISKYIFQSMPVIDEFLNYEERINNTSLPIEQFLYLDNHQWPRYYNGEEERQLLVKAMRKIRKMRARLVKYKDAYLGKGKERYRKGYKKYEKRISDEIQTLRIQTPYLKKLLDTQKRVYQRMKNIVDAINNLKVKLPSKNFNDEMKSSKSKEYSREELMGIKEAIKKHQQTLKEFESEVHSSWDNINKRIKKIQKWEDYFLEAKRQLIEANICLVIAIAKKYFRRGVDFMDAVQEGNTGLIKAVEKFDHLKGYKFSTYGIWWIKQAIAKALAEQHDTIRIPVHTVTVINKIKKARHNLLQEYGLEPSVEEVSKATGFSVDKIKIAQRLDHGSLSLEDPATSDEVVLLGDLIPDTNLLSPANDTWLTLLGEYLEEALNTTLSPREKKVLQLRFGLIDGNQKTLEDIGMIFNVTRERVRQIEANALRKMKRCNYRKKLEEFLSMGEFEPY
ncbi:sigma-70 family RNA polymerase sigma factor [candidate division WOR-3 bacterium]|nr:sigma-70 family RNA polymerase sigma factor [candidate division WOR-3 bacterium]